MQSTHQAPTTVANSPRCPKCDSSVVRVKHGLYNCDTGKRIRKRFRLSIAWGLLVAWGLCSILALVGAITEQDQWIWLIPVVIIVVFGVILGLPGYLILRRFKHTETGELLLYSCSTCFHRWQTRVDAALDAMPPNNPKTESDTRGDAEAREVASTLPEQSGVLMDIVEETVETDVMSPGDAKVHQDVIQESAPKSKVEEKVSSGARIPRVKFAFISRFRRKKIPVVRIALFSFLGTLAGIFLQVVLIGVVLSFDFLDDLIVALWFIPAVVAQETIRNFGPKPSFEHYPIHTLVMWLIISFVSFIGAYLIIPEYGLHPWIPYVILIITAAVLTFTGKSAVASDFYPYCEECEAFLIPDLIRRHDIEETEGVLNALRSAEFSEIADIPVVRRETQVAKLQIHTCPKCGEGMVTLFLKGVLDGNTYRSSSVFSEKLSAIEINELRKIMEASRK